MHASRTPPEEWQRVMEQKGFSSLRRLAEKAGVSHVTVNRLVLDSGHKTTDENMRKIAEVLDLSKDQVYEMANRSEEVGVPWKAPEDARFLTTKQRAAVEHVIRVMVASNLDEDEEPDEAS